MQTKWAVSVEQVDPAWAHSELSAGEAESISLHTLFVTLLHCVSTECL